MSLSAIRTEVKTILQNVTDIGVVHDYERWSNDWNTILSMFQPSGKAYIRGWMITRRATQEVVVTQGLGGSNQREHSFVIKGVFGLKDDIASEKTFQDLIESICSALRGNPTLNGSAIECDPPQVMSVDIRMFSQVLCHYAEIELKAAEIVTR